MGLARTCRYSMEAYTVGCDLCPNGFRKLWPLSKRSAREGGAVLVYRFLLHL
jgi:hypothetical protein